MLSTKLFFRGGSPAVRLPEEFRFKGTEVHVRRVRDNVVPSAVPRASSDALIDALVAFEPGTVVQREQPVEPQPPAPHRPNR